MKCDEVADENLGIMLRSELHDALMLLGISASDQELDEYLQIADADGSNAIDMQEWLALCGILVKPPYDDSKLLAAFELLFPNQEHIPVSVVRTKLQRVLENAYRHLPDCNPHEVSCFVDDMISALDTENAEIIDIHECIRMLCTRYNPSLPEATNGSSCSSATSTNKAMVRVGSSILEEDKLSLDMK